MKEQEKELTAVIETVLRETKNCDMSIETLTDYLVDRIKDKVIIEDSIILSRKEYEILKVKEKEKHWFQTCMSVWENGKIDGSKETAEKFLQLAYDRCLEKSFIKKVEELAKQFGVEIKE